MANQQMITAVASSSMFNSSSSSESLKNYDVFLSFRGEDTRNNFTSLLYDALTQKKVKTYIDYQLERGDEISPTLMKAIEESHTSIIIFSENYASSKWCLEELSKILECKKHQGHVVIPVFYKVDPSHVRKQIGSYKQAFAKHEKDMRHNKDKVHQWKAALTEAANLAGWTWDSKTDRTESEFIKDIVGDVLKKLDVRYPIEVKGLVGIEENYADIKSLLDIGSSEVRIIGIWGMGGIGKTTIATALYAKLSSLFEGHCFLANVREESAKIGSNALRNKKFSELFKGENLNFDAPRLVSNFAMTRRRRTKVFIVLDDVATSKQLEDLLLDYDYLGLGSRVIVTTRNKQLLSHVHEIHKVKQLNDDDSLKLFCAKSFGEKHPKNGYEEVLERVIDYCKGIPLALKVLGAHLRGKSKEIWDDELRKLRKIPDLEIQNVLKLSYDDLDRTQKDIFLDIACFYKGEYKDRVTSVLEACDFFPTRGIEVLLDMALITISESNTIEMHDLIQEMGWEIIHQESIKDPGRRSRLWNTEDVCDVFKNNKGTELVEGIRLDVSKIGDLYLSSDSFAKMTNLRLLEFYYGDWTDRCTVNLCDGLGSLPDKLRWLRWPRYCLKSLPSTFCAKMLVKLDIPNSNLEKLWDGAQNFENLKTINLYGSKHLVEVPDLSMTPNLEEVYLEWCESLREVHPSIFSLPKLRLLCLRYCTQLESLKTDVHLKSLHTLELQYCSSLKEFSVTSEEMEYLDLYGTAIQELPSSFARNRKLRQLYLVACDKLKIDGKSLFDDQGMGSITQLNFSGCIQLDAPTLQFILKGVPSLTLLSVSYCCNLESLPANVKNLPMLRGISIEGCSKIVFVPELPPSLERLGANNCTSLTSVEIGDGLLSSLEYLDLSSTNVETLSANLKNLSKLKELILNNCTKLVALPELPSSLKRIYAANCSSLETNLTQVLQHRLQTISHSVKHGHEYNERHGLHFLTAYVLFPCVPDLFETRNSLSLTGLPLSNLCGFLFWITLSESMSDVENLRTHRFIYQYIGVDSGTIDLLAMDFNSDHLIIWYVDIKYLHMIQEIGVNDHCTNISFAFKTSQNYKSEEGIKGCYVHPVFNTDLDLELELDGSITEDIVELESNVQSSHNQEPLPQTNNLDELSPRNQMQEVIHQTIEVCTEMEDEQRDLIEKDSCDCFMVAETRLDAVPSLAVEKELCLERSGEGESIVTQWCQDMIPGSPKLPHKFGVVLGIKESCT